MAQEIGFDNVMIQVFFYLFERKIYGKITSHSAYEVYKCIKTDKYNFLPLFQNNKNISEKNVSDALRNLEMTNFVKTVDTNTKQKYRKRGELKTVGRPAKKLFQLNDVNDIMKLIENKLEEKRRNLIGVFSELGDLEEATSIHTLEGGN